MANSNNLSACYAGGERVIATPAEVRAYLSRLQQEATGGVSPVDEEPSLIIVPSEGGKHGLQE